MKCFSLFVSCGLLFFSCRDYSPKPFGNFRITMPEAKYYKTDTFQKFEFDLSDQAVIANIPQRGENIFFNIVYPQFHAQIYCSYMPIKKKEDLTQFSEESRKFVYLHTIKADAINEYVFEYAEQKVYGLVFDVKGEVASPTQFILTDSLKSFFRGALYFDFTSGTDSITPVLEYINNDIQLLIESFRWKI